MNVLHAKRKFWLEAAALLAAALLASMFAAPALGQGKPPAEPGTAPCSPSQPPGSPGTTVGAGEPRSEVTPPENLSQRLARSDGVICPPSNVDPEMKLPTPPAGNSMPVIPPPGSPGGDPTVRPK
jgi:hypothetical protein